MCGVGAIPCGWIRVGNPETLGVGSPRSGPSVYQFGPAYGRFIRNVAQTVAVR